MTITDLVPDRDVCEKLKEKGFPQETQFYWIKLGDYKDYQLFIKLKNYKGVFYVSLDGSITVNHEHRTIENIIAAPLTDELLAELPKDTVITRDIKDSSFVVYSSSYKNWVPIWDKKLPNALDRLWMERG